jgi:hypothetical protein
MPKTGKKRIQKLSHFHTNIWSRYIKMDQDKYKYNNSSSDEDFYKVEKEKSGETGQHTKNYTVLKDKYF